MFKLLLKIFLWLVAIVVVLIAAGAGFIWYWGNPPQTAPGELLGTEPQQRIIPGAIKQVGDDVIMPVALFQIDGLVLARKDYTQGPESRLSPMDVVLGWGPLRTPRVAGKVGFTQADRSYHWKAGASGLDDATILRNTANIHLIPDSPKIKAFLASIAQGDFVSLKGNLVVVANTSGWQWVSSFLREDEGLAGTEILLVTSGEKFTMNGDVPMRAGDGPPASGSYTLQAPVKVQLAHGEMTVPANAVIEISGRNGTTTKGRYNGLEFVVPTKSLR